MNKLNSKIGIVVLVLLLILISCENPLGSDNEDSNLGNNATLSNLTVSEGELNPRFNSTVTSYTLDVPNTVESVAVTPTLADSNATAVVNGNTVSSGIVSEDISLATGKNDILVVVTAEDESTQQTYTIVVTRASASLSTDASLSNIEVSEGKLAPVFDSSETSYTLGVPNSVDSIAITPTASDNNAVIEIDGNSVDSGSASTDISLAVGETDILVKVTAEDGATTKTYTLSVTRAPAGASSESSLSDLETSEGNLTPAFNSGEADYSFGVVNEVSAITITPTATDDEALILVNGDPVDSGSASGDISLTVGENTIDIEVIAEDMQTSTTYTLTVTRAADQQDQTERTLSIDLTYEGSEQIDSDSPIRIFLYDVSDPDDITGFEDYAYNTSISTYTPASTSVEFTQSSDGLEPDVYSYFIFIDVNNNGSFEFDQDKDYQSNSEEDAITVSDSGLTEVSITFGGGSEIIVEDPPESGSEAFQFNFAGFPLDGPYKIIVEAKPEVPLNEGGTTFRVISTVDISGGSGVLEWSTSAFSASENEPANGKGYIFRFIQDENEDGIASSGENIYTVNTPVIYDEASAPVPIEIDWTSATSYASPAYNSKDLTINIQNGPVNLNNVTFKFAYLQLKSFSGGGARPAGTWSTDADGDGSQTLGGYSVPNGDSRLMLYYDENDDASISAGEAYSMIDTVDLDTVSQVTFDNWLVY